MAFVSSHTSRVSYDNSSASLTDLTAYVTNISGVDLTRANLDTTSLNDAAFTYLLGLKGGNTITLSGNWDSTLHTHMTGVEALTSGATQTLRYSPAGTGSGSPYLTVETLLTNYTFSSAVNGLVTWTATLQTTGATSTGTH